MSVEDRLEGVRGRLRAVRDRLAPLVGTVRGWIRDEPMVGIAISVALHVLIIALVLHYGGPASTYSVKRGEPMFVELPELKEQAARGAPGAPAAPAPPAPKAAPSPPAPRAQSPAPARPAAPEPPRVASARPPEPARERPAPVPDKPAPVVEKPVPRPPEPPVPEAKNATPVPAPQASPAPAPAAPPSPAPPAAAPSGPPADPARGRPGGPQVAAIPPGPKEQVFDLKSLGRGGGGAGGAGGRGEGRGGIEGEPIPLDSRDPKYSDYLDRVRRMIKERWGYPCVKSGTGCEYKTAELIIEFGIAKDGHVPFISLVRTSGFAIYDDYALNAIRLASPFPPVPDSLSKKGFPIMARFHYVVDTSLVNTLR